MPGPRGAWRSLVAHLLWEQGVGGSNPLAPTAKLAGPRTEPCGCSSKVEPQPSKLVMGVRFPSPALDRSAFQTESVRAGAHSGCGHAEALPYVMVVCLHSLRPYPKPGLWQRRRSPISRRGARRDFGAGGTKLRVELGYSERMRPDLTSGFDRPLEKRRCSCLCS
jgi:hypothetical protein